MVKGFFSFLSRKEEDQVEQGGTTVNEAECLEQDESITEEDAFFAKDFLTSMLDAMGVVSVVKVVKSDDSDLYLEIKCDEIGIVIGKEGSTLNAIQFLIKNILQNRTRKRVNVTVDANQYRERRIQHLEAKSERAAKRAMKENREVRMGAMPAFERRIIHMALEGHGDVYTFSRGDKDRRQVIIAPKKGPKPN